MGSAESRERERAEAKARPKEKVPRAVWGYALFGLATWTCVVTVQVVTSTVHPVRPGEVEVPLRNRELVREMAVKRGARHACFRADLRDADLVERLGDGQTIKCVEYAHFEIEIRHEVRALRIPVGPLADALSYERASFGCLASH